MKRYNVFSQDLFEVEGGPYVRYEDVEAELTHLRAANAELVEVLRELQRCAQKQGFNDRYETTMGRVQAALSRAEQAKPETCVWTLDPDPDEDDEDVFCWRSSCGSSHRKRYEGLYSFCPFCGERIEQAGKAEGRQG